MLIYLFANMIIYSWLLVAWSKDGWLNVSIKAILFLITLATFAFLMIQLGYVVQST